MSTPLTDDQISKRIFYAGLFGLPWLQLVHSMGFYSNKRNNLISAESGTSSFDSSFYPIQAIQIF